MVKYRQKVVLFMIILLGIFSLLATGGGEEKKHSPVDVDGTWQYFYTEQFVPGYKGPYLALIDQSGNDVTVSIESIGSGNGTVSGSSIAFSCADNGGITTNAEGIADSYEMNGNWTNSGANSGTWWAKKGIGFGYLIHHQAAEYPWRLVVTVYAKNAMDVYITGDQIDGDYELFPCADYEGYQIWQSTNDAGCGDPKSGYTLKESFSRPLYVTVHTVTSSGVDTEEITVNGYDEEF